MESESVAFLWHVNPVFQILQMRIKVSYQNKNKIAVAQKAAFSNKIAM